MEDLVESSISEVVPILLPARPDSQTGQHSLQIQGNANRLANQPLRVSPGDHHVDTGPLHVASC